MLRRKGASRHQLVGTRVTDAIPVPGSPYELDVAGEVLATEVEYTVRPPAGALPDDGYLYLIER